MPPSWIALGINDPTTELYLNGHFPEVSGEGSKASGQLVAAAARARKAFTAAHRFADLRAKDKTLNEGERILKTGQYVRRAVSEAEALYNQAIKGAGARMAELNRERGARLTPPSVAGQATINDAIRDRILAMPSDDRIKYMNGALEADDFDVLKAVVEAPGMLSGLESPTWERVKDGYLGKVCPEPQAEYKALSSALKRTQVNFEALADHTGQLVDFNAVAALEAGAMESVDA